MSPLTYSPLVFLPLPHYLYFSAFWHFPSTLIRSRCVPKPSRSATPHHISHTLNTQKTGQILTSLLSFNDIPHIHLTIINYASFQSHTSILSGHKLYIFPFIWYNAPRAGRMGDNSLQNQPCMVGSPIGKCLVSLVIKPDSLHLAPSVVTLALDASSTATSPPDEKYQSCATLVTYMNSNSGIFRISKMGVQIFAGH